MSDELDDIDMSNEEMKFVFNLHETMKNRRFLLVYEGEFTQDVTKVLLSMTEKKIEMSGEESNIKRKIFNVMVECLQNISKHTPKFEFHPDITLKSSIFTIGRDDTWYYISTGNTIDNKDIEKLKGRLEIVNNASPEELKLMYKDVITGKIPPHKPNSTGLGLIDVARKTKEPINYQFIQISETHSFYSFQTKIRSSLAEQETQQVS